MSGFKPCLERPHQGKSAKLGLPDAAQRGPLKENPHPSKQRKRSAAPSQRALNLTSASKWKNIKYVGKLQSQGEPNRKWQPASTTVAQNPLTHQEQRYKPRSQYQRNKTNPDITKTNPRTKSKRNGPPRGPRSKRTRNEEKQENKPKANCAHLAAAVCLLVNKQPELTTEEIKKLAMYQAKRTDPQSPQGDRVAPTLQSYNMKVVLLHTTSSPSGKTPTTIKSLTTQKTRRPLVVAAGSHAFAATSLPEADKFTLFDFLAKNNQNKALSWSQMMEHARKYSEDGYVEISVVDSSSEETQPQSNRDSPERLWVLGPKKKRPETDKADPGKSDLEIAIAESLQSHDQQRQAVNATIATVQGLLAGANVTNVEMKGDCLVQVNLLHTKGKQFLRENEEDKAIIKARRKEIATTSYNNQKAAIDPGNPNLIAKTDELRTELRKKLKLGIYLDDHEVQAISDIDQTTIIVYQIEETETGEKTMITQIFTPTTSIKGRPQFMLFHHQHYMHVEFPNKKDEERALDEAQKTHDQFMKEALPMETGPKPRETEAEPETPQAEPQGKQTNQKKARDNKSPKELEVRLVSPPRVQVTCSVLGPPP